jgi:Leucine-rich repeat (LRR) protein
MIMHKFDLEIPEQASAVILKNLKLGDVFEDDMKYFVNLTYLNLRDNQKIPMYKLRNLTNLVNLDLSFNKIEDLKILSSEVVNTEHKNHGLVSFKTADPFKCMTHLNLSFNNLSIESLGRILVLKNSLKLLDLSGNNLFTLPEIFTQFEKLETLNLSNNSFKNTKENIL